MYLVLPTLQIISNLHGTWNDPENPGRMKNAAVRSAMLSLPKILDKYVGICTSLLYMIYLMNDSWLQGDPAAKSDPELLSFHMIQLKCCFSRCSNLHPNCQQVCPELLK